MLPQLVWNMPPLGTINVHASLLPQYRGAAPINWAIINGEKETGVTTFKLKHEIDTGAVLLQEKVMIAQQDNAGTLHDKLMNTGAALLVKTIRGIADNSITEKPQYSFNEKEWKHAPKIFKEDMKINWEKSAKEIINLIRGLSPYPTAFTTLNDKQLKAFTAHTDDEGERVPFPFTHETDGKTYLRFAAKDGWVYIDELQLEGKKRMNVVEFLRGYRTT
jgi:methionyl-tRNA formyltransferase